jgi:hypothetical protein
MVEKPTLGQAFLYRRLISLIRFPMHPYSDLVDQSYLLFLSLPLLLFLLGRFLRETG